MNVLRTCIVLDYQNMHLTAHALYDSTRFGPKHECLLDPMAFAVNLADTRNARQRAGHPYAEVSSVLVYRGLPLQQYEPKPYARSLAQQANWERDRRVKVHLRPLHYRPRYDSHGTPVLDADGKKIIDEVREKGVDVLCALALVREAASPANDLVVLASHDTDLEPALDEALQQGHAKNETCQWFCSSRLRHTSNCGPAVATSGIPASVNPSSDVAGI